MRTTERIRAPSARLATVAITATLYCFVPAASVAGSASAPLLPTWSLGDLYPTQEAWASALQAAHEHSGQIERFKGTLGKSAEAMRTALSAVSDLQREAGRLIAYAGLGADEDLRFAPAQQRRAQGQALEASVAEKSAWIAPEVIALGAQQVHAFLGEDHELGRRFGFSLENMLRRAPHTLGAEAEAVLAAGEILLAQPDNVFGQLAGAELPRPKVRLANGTTVKLDQASYEQNRISAVRADRKRIMDAFFGSLGTFQGTFGANLHAQVLGDVYAARARHFDSSLEAALFDSNMPADVYRQLIAQARAALPTLHRYLRLRRHMLGIRDSLAYYDNYPPLTARPPGQRYDVATSEATTLAALAPMGEDYLAQLRRGFAGRWMHAPPGAGKASGAYMNGFAYDVHPYLLLNHADDYESLSTFAHEWGHAVHTLLANASQPFETSRYSTFIAESASIANEMLLNDFLVAGARTRAEKLYFLSQGLESIRTTFFRQVLFADFQRAMHEEVEHGKSLSGQRLSELYCGLLKQYYGEADGVMKIDPAYCTEWIYIPHFYYGYYVYQYATSMVGAAEFTDAILREGAPARDRFVAMLKAGGSDYPYEIYRRAGIDLAQPQPYEALVARMNRLLDEFEALAGKAGQ